jgi:hypothetical protein
VPAGLADPNVIPRHDELDTDPAVIAAIAAVRPIRPAPSPAMCLRMR